MSVSVLTSGSGSRENSARLQKSRKEEFSYFLKISSQLPSYFLLQLWEKGDCMDCVHTAWGLGRCVVPTGVEEPVTQPGRGTSQWVWASQAGAELSQDHCDHAAISHLAGLCPLPFLFPACYRSLHRAQRYAKLHPGQSHFALISAIVLQSTQIAILHFQTGRSQLSSLQGVAKTKQQIN